MKVTTKELFTQQYDVVGITMQFSLIEGENNKRGIFVMYTYDDFNNILSVSEWTTVNWMFGEMEKVAIEDIEKVELIKKINSFKDCWELTEEENITSDDNLIEQWNEWNQPFDEPDSDCTFMFENGTYIEINQGEDGYIARITKEGEEPIEGLFDDIEDLCYGLSSIAQESDNKEDIYMLANQIRFSFDDHEFDTDEIFEMLMK